jgi:arginyl-tRNA synthetase
MMMKPQRYILETIHKALAKAGFEEQEIKLEKPKQEGFGDFAVTVAMSLAKSARKPPREIARQLVDAMDVDPEMIKTVEIAGPGFINFTVAESCLRESVLDILDQDRSFGTSDWGNGKRIQFEFVSANPTGPLNIVSARAAAVGDALASLFNAVGCRADREFYVNDAGRQVRLLGRSVSARYMTALGHDTEVPEEGYHGLYLKDLAEDLVKNEGDRYAHLDPEDREEQLSRVALETMIQRQQKSVERYRLHYDCWFRESRLREENAQATVLEKFNKRGLTYTKEGALWFRASDYGDEKDRVLVTNEGQPTYFLVDIAYHENKYERGYTKIVDLLGPDHHGYIDRMRAALIALGHPDESFQVEIIQQVNLYRGGKVVKMSKRAGEIIEMDELIDEVGVDAARYFFVDRRLSQSLDFDIDLAKKQSDENPVYYVQYAHARICNVLKFAEEQGFNNTVSGDLSQIGTESEWALVKKLIDFPETVSKAAEFFEPHRVTNYLHDLATLFHRFYHDNRVVTEDEALSRARLTLVRTTRLVFANGLDLLNISAPEQM